jgi:hypothetical protein
LNPIGRDDPTMARVLGEKPKLERWSRWRMGETSRVYVLMATSLLRRLLIVIDKESFEVIRLAEGSRLSRNWMGVPRQQWPEYLGNA